MNTFNTIGLIARHQPAKASSVTSAIIRQMNLLCDSLTGLGKSVILDQQTADHINSNTFASQTLSDLAQQTDLGIVLGGDGRLLEAAPFFAHAETPLLGINYGRLGFLADISAEYLQPVLEVMHGRFIPENRLLVEAKVERGNKVVATSVALNDIVLYVTASKMIEFELYINDTFVYSQRSDGIVIATPTGSTAYALSAGGPIMQPDLDTLVLVPNSAHTLASRPIVVGADSEIKIRVGSHPYPAVSCDGQTKITTEQNDLITINKYPHKLALIHPVGYDFYRTCREKLGWGQKLGRVRDM